MRNIFRRGRTQQLARHFLYISDTKLDMLFDQIPKHVLGQITAEVSVNLKVVNIRLVAAGVRDSVRSDKLAVVERYIDKHFHVGSTQEVGPDGYFRGVMEMQWGFIGEESWNGVSQAPVVIFKGREGPSTVVLGGSRRHVIGSPGGLREIRSGSALPDIVTTLLEYSHDCELQSGGGDLEQRRFNQPGAAWDAEHLSLTGPSQRVEFLATRWTEETLGTSDSEHHVIIGSPWYMATAQRVAGPGLAESMLNDG